MQQDSEPLLDFYLCLLDDRPAAIGVALDRAEQAPLESHPWLLEVRVALRAPDEDGLAGDDEFAALQEAEEALSARLAEDAGALLVGSATTDGLRVWFYHAAREEPLADGVAAALAGTDYDPDCTVERDPEWQMYGAVLLPDPLEYQSIQNLKVCAALREHGDPLEPAREVSHWAFFKDEEARKAFSSAVVEQGFAITRELAPGEEEGSEGHGLLFSREDSCEPQAVDRLVLPLYLLAEEHGGVYEGWETLVYEPAQANGAPEAE